MSEYYAVQRSGSTDHLAHYGVKGMKWGVRKAVLLGNDRKLRRKFNKAARKLNRLQDKALRSGKYAAKAAAYGTAATGAGALAIGGTGLVKNASSGVANLMQMRKAILENQGRTGIRYKAYRKASEILEKGGNKVGEWGKKDTTVLSSPKFYKDSKGQLHAHPRIKNETKINNNTLFRIGAGAAAAGLGAASARNAYIASHGRKYLEKADDWRRAMDESFAGTKYEGQYTRDSRRKKRR